MAVQAGKDLLIKIDQTGDGSFATIAGLRATRASFNIEAVDVTSLESSGGWRELLAGAGSNRPLSLALVCFVTQAAICAPARSFSTAKFQPFNW